jgi:hypothetical protein
MASPQVQRPQQVQHNSGSHVTVGCKLPNGLHLDFNEPGKPLRRITVKGTNDSHVIGGFGITENVPEEFFSEWLKRNKDMPVVKNGLIFGLPKTESTEAKAAEMKSVKNELEPIDPNVPGHGIEKINTRN